MKKCLFSKYVKLNDGDFNILSEDIRKFNLLKRTAFSLICDAGGDKDVVREDDRIEPVSIQVYLKELVPCNDYFRNSARQEAKASFDSAMECLKNQKTELELQIDQMAEKLKATESRLKHLKKEKESLVKRSAAKKSGSRRKVKFASYAGGNESEAADGKFQTGKGKHTRVYENQYLFELYYLDPQIKQLKHRIRAISQRKNSCENRLSRVNTKIEAHSPSVCFGSRKLFRAQKTVYKNLHQEWKNAFRKSRDNGMTISGRKDAAQGNFVFKYDAQTRDLRYRSMDGKEITFHNAGFPYGQKFVDNAVTCEKAERQAVAWRLEIHGRKVLIKCMVELPEVKRNGYFAGGCIGFDTNADNLAVSETDENGNLLFHKIIHFDLAGKTSSQREHILSDAVEQVFQIAKERKKPVAMEDLKDFKQEYLYSGKKINRILSEFAHRKISMLAESKAYKYETGLCKVNPAFTSQIGKVKYMRKYGLSVHESAAFAIARRAMGLQESTPKAIKHLVPEKNKNKHHWSQWRFLTCHIKKYKHSVFYTYLPYTKFKEVKEMNDYVSNQDNWSKKVKPAAGTAA